MQGQDKPPVAVVQLIAPLDQNQPAQEASQAIKDDSAVITGGRPLEGTHGKKGIICCIIASQQGVEWYARPALTAEQPGKRPAYPIGMRQAPVTDSAQCRIPGLLTGVYQAAEKKGLPISAPGQSAASLTQPPGIKTPEDDIILQHQDMFGASGQAPAQTAHVRIINGPDRIIATPVHQNKLGTRQQPDNGQLSFDPLTAIGTV